MNLEIIDKIKDLHNAFLMTKDEKRLQRAIDKGWAKLEKDFQVNLLSHAAQQI